MFAFVVLRNLDLLGEHFDENKKDVDEGKECDQERIMSANISYC
jgi:hypothetical protein